MWVFDGLWDIVMSLMGLWITTAPAFTIWIGVLLGIDTAQALFIERTAPHTTARLIKVGEGIALLCIISSQPSLR